MENVIHLISDGDIISLFIKLFGVVLGFLYLFYSLVIVRQVSVMRHEVAIQDGGLLLMVSYVQVFLALVVLIFALFL
jgi:hypothetical protein